MGPPAALKLVVNVGSYGIYSEFNPRVRRRGETVPVVVHGRKESLPDRVAAPEDPGRYCFPCLSGFRAGPRRSGQQSHLR